jgi:hypothetical protein
MKLSEIQLASIPEAWLNQTIIFFAHAPCAPSDKESGPGFFLGFCDVVKMVIIHKIIKANFGYIPNLKIAKTTGSFNILGYLLEIII